MKVYEQKLALEDKLLQLQRALTKEEVNDIENTIENLEDELVDIDWLNRTIYAA